MDRVGNTALQILFTNLPKTMANVCVAFLSFREASFCFRCFSLAAELLVKVVVAERVSLLAEDLDLVKQIKLANILFLLASLL